ncbi:UNVERIFIED_CONTAM: Peroxisome biogenesis protein 6 [Sesamum angustifolium]|uniref:Peroxisomal ATPase PEX6 n=1 Tax=Sesamum angustifolium TaxID=2727405 RepID=A0AAW2QUA6_9LAMI
MVERRKRKPLVLSSTKALVDSLLNSRKTTECADGIEEIAASPSAPTLQLTAGILRYSKDTTFDSVDGTVLVGLSTSALKRLSITSGSLIVIKNVDANVNRIGQAVVLDPLSAHDNSSEQESACSHAPRTICCAEWKKSTVILFVVKENGAINVKDNEPSSVSVALQPWGELPKYASHLRASFVKIPECGTLQHLKTSSSVEAKEHQNLIDLALNDYFSIDRYLARVTFLVYGTIRGTFSESQSQSNCSCSWGGVASAVPPDTLIPRSRSPSPLQDDAVLSLANILAPTLCPSPLSSKFRIAILLHGVPAEAFNTARRYCPTILLLRHFEVFRNLAAQEGSPYEQVGVNSEVASVIKQFTEPSTEDEDDYIEESSDGDSQLKVTEMINQHPVLLVAAADSTEGLPPTIRRCFSHEIKVGPLTEEQRFQLLSQSFQHISELLPNNSAEDLVKDIVGQTSGFMPRDLRAVVADAGANLISERKKLEPGNPDARHGSFESNSIEDSSKLGDVPLDLGKENLTKALERSKKRNASALGTPKVPNVKWEDVGGLEDVKKSILDTVQLPLLHKDLFSSGLRKRSGVLLYGPPGTGKTLLAKAVATECSLNFLSVKGPELINMYIGESEKNVRDIFQKARAARPCVIFFDELDSLAPARGASGDSGGVMDRVVSQMLAEIDGLNDSSQDLFIIGASNRPDLIDPALLRPGRFDKLLYVGVNSEASYRERVLKALTRKFKLHEDVSLYEIAQKCPPNFTGADMYALCADAWFHAAKRKVLYADSDSGSPDQSNTIVVEYEDFIEALRELSPSLSMAELKKYEMLRDQFRGPSR